MPIAPDDFAYICALVLKQSAIVLEPGKEYLVESRLNPVIRAEGFDSFTELVSALQARPHGSLPDIVVEAMTTNETSFFRDVHPFNALRETLLPELIDKRKTERTLRIWCAACSSGQEPYSICFLIKEHFPELINWDVTIWCTDLSVAILEQARRGIYTQLQVNRGLAAPLLIKYFERHGTEWEVKPAVRAMLEFDTMNLIGIWPRRPPHDLVLMRNVLIYFDLPTKSRILGKVRKSMASDGYMILGGPETTMNLDDNFVKRQIGRTGCYQLKSAADNGNAAKPMSIAVGSA